MLMDGIRPPEEEATRLLVNYGGEPDVTDDGVVVYVFKDIRKTAELGEQPEAPCAGPGSAWNRGRR